MKDGFQLRAEQRAEPRLSAIPAVAMSADPRLELHREALRAHASLHAPLDIDVLLAAAARSRSTCSSAASG